MHSLRESGRADAMHFARRAALAVSRQVDKPWIDLKMVCKGHDGMRCL